MGVSGPRRGGVLVSIGLILTVMPTAHAEPATQRDFWSAAARDATATIYAPSAASLRALGFTAGSVSFASLKLTMVCRDEWNVDANYGDEGSRSLELYQATRDCSPDQGDFDTPPNRSTVKVAGATVEIVYHGCRDSGPQDLPEDACPATRRIYSAYGTLPAIRDKKPSFLQLDALGLSRVEVRSVLRSLRPAG